MSNLWSIESAQEISLFHVFGVYFVSNLFCCWWNLAQNSSSSTEQNDSPCNWFLKSYLKAFKELNVKQVFRYNVQFLPNKKPLANVLFESFFYLFPKSFFSLCLNLVKICCFFLQLVMLKLNSVLARTYSHWLSWCWMIDWLASKAIVTPPTTH